MAIGGVIATFVMTIIFGIIAPTFDVSSDVKLLFDVVTFQVGNSYELAGCRSCHGLSSDEVYQPKVESCKQCLSSPRYKIWSPSTSCGFTPHYLDKIRELKEDPTCTRKLFGFNDTIDKLGHEDECKPKDHCCIHRTNTSRTLSQFTSTDRRINTYLCKTMSNLTKENNCQFCKHTGTSSGAFCKSLFTRSLTRNPHQVKKMFSQAKQNCRKNTYFKMNENFSNKSMNESITIENNFTHKDQCGISFTTHPFNAVQDNTVCDKSVCSIHLDSVSLKFYAKEFSYEKWENLMNYDNANRRIGGQICNVLTIYGWSILIPILLNITFHICIFYRDLNKKKVSRFEIIPVLILCYPQWRCIKMLVSYLYHKNESRLQSEKQTYEREVETMEAFAEAGIQVGTFIMLSSI
jgi:hypothetical protein